MSHHLRPAETAHPIHAFIAGRWSPYAIDSRPVPSADLHAIFEAARWAPSSYNEQPWRFIVATSDQPGSFARVLSCLVDANQAWAKHAPVLALGCYMRNFARNGTANKAAAHDLGQAAAMLSIEAAARGLVVHQMIGILPDKARELFALPEDAEAHTALAIGYPGDPAKLPPDAARRDAARRPRNPIASFVFGDGWAKPGPVR